MAVHGRGMTTKPWAIFLVIFITFLTSSAQILYKFGADRLVLDPNLITTFFALLQNYHLIFGVMLYIIGGVLVIVALKGGEVTVIYPIIATSYIWVSFLSIYFIGETMNMFKWLGVLFIIVGILSIQFGSHKKEMIHQAEVP